MTRYRVGLSSFFNIYLNFKLFYSLMENINLKSISYYLSTTVFSKIQKLGFAS